MIDIAKSCSQPILGDAKGDYVALGQAESLIKQMLDDIDFVVDSPFRPTAAGCYQGRFFLLWPDVVTLHSAEIDYY